MVGVLNWLVERPIRMLGAVAICILLFTWGFDRTFFYPQRMKEAALAETTAFLEQKDGEVAQAMSRFLQENGWYLRGAGYVDDLDQKLTQARDLLSVESETGARRLLQLATTERRSKTAVELTERAKQQAQTAVTLAQEVSSKLDAVAAQRDSVRTTMPAMNDIIKIASGMVLTETQQLNVELKSHISKYTKEAQTTLQQLNSKLSQAEVHLQNAISAMPADDDRTGVGDPSMAQDELDQAKILIDEVNTLMSQVTATLDGLKEARENAARLTTEASTHYTDSLAYVDRLHTQTSFWLKNSYVALAEADAARDAAELAIVTKVEGNKVDLVAAYKSATFSIARTVQARSIADDEIADEKATREAIARIATRTNAVNTQIGVARSARTVLDTYHNDAVWTSVASNIATAEQYVKDASAHSSTARGYIQLEIQRFADGKKSANDGLKKLDDAETLAKTVVTEKDRLEGFRSKWSSVESSAASVISVENANLQNYRGYDSGAGASYDNAVALLASARQKARNGYYEQAVNEASGAYNAAYGMGTRAYQSYLAELERQRQATREAIAAITRQAEMDAQATRSAIAAAAAAQRAAEEAARQAAEDSSSSSFGGSSYNDSSDYGGGGSSFGGDSDYGSSGGDSDYGSSGGDSDY